MDERTRVLLAEWAEKASCYRWLHGRAEKNIVNQIMLLQYL